MRSSFVCSAGEATPDDVHDMAKKYGCDVVVVVPTGWRLGQ